MSTRVLPTPVRPPTTHTRLPGTARAASTSDARSPPLLRARRVRRHQQPHATPRASPRPAHARAHAHRLVARRGAMLHAAHVGEAHREGLQVLGLEVLHTADE